MNAMLIIEPGVGIRHAAIRKAKKARTEYLRPTAPT